MPYFKDTQGALHYLSDGDIANAGASGLLLPDPTWQSITDAQADTIRNPPMTLAQAQAAQIALLQAAYQNAITQPVTFTTSGGLKKTFQADSESQIVLIKAQQGYAIVGAVPDGFYWVASDNTEVPFTLADLKGLYAAMLAQGWSAFQHLQTQKAAVRAATTPAAVNAVSW